MSTGVTEALDELYTLWATHCCVWCRATRELEGLFQQMTGRSRREKRTAKPRTEEMPSTGGRAHSKKVRNCAGITSTRVYNTTLRACMAHLGWFSPCEWFPLIAPSYITYAADALQHRRQIRQTR